MKFLNFSLLLIMLIFSFACSDEKKRSTLYSSETQTFKKYLSANFPDEIITDSSSYILMSSNGCGGCLHSFVNRLMFSSTQNPKMKFVLSAKLLSRLNLTADSLRNSAVLIDFENVVDRLPFHQGNIGVVQLANGAIYNLYSVDPSQTDSVLEVLSKK